MTQNGTIETPPVMDTEQAERFLSAVNLDEVMIEIVVVKIREYKNVEVLDDEGQPVLDPDNKPLTYRKPYTRTAHIQNFVPLPLYYEFIAIQDKFNSMDTEEQTKTMTKFVLRVWQVTEEWMTEWRLGMGLDLPAIGALFRRFFDPNRLNRSKV